MSDEHFEGKPLVSPDTKTPVQVEGERVGKVSDLELVDWSVVAGQPVTSVVPGDQRPDYSHSFEPRLEADYTVTGNDGRVVTYTALLVLEKDADTVATAYLDHRRRVH